MELAVLWPSPHNRNGKTIVRRQLAIPSEDRLQKGASPKQQSLKSHHENIFEPKPTFAKSKFIPQQGCREAITAFGNRRPSTPMPTSMQFIRRATRAIREVRKTTGDSRISMIPEEPQVVKQPSVLSKPRDLNGASNPSSKPPRSDNDHEPGKCQSCADLSENSKINNSVSWWAALSPSAAARERQWQSKLTPMQFKVLRMKGTEPVNSGKLLKWFAPGMYVCAACNEPLYKDEHKIPTTCGWPAFTDCIPNALLRERDKKVPEISCRKCGGHLGHVFKSDRYPPPHHERHCVNSISLKFVPACANELSD